MIRAPENVMVDDDKVSGDNIAVKENEIVHALRVGDRDGEGREAAWPAREEAGEEEKLPIFVRPLPITTLHEFSSENEP